MKKLTFNHITERPKKGANSERATILEDFLKVLNRNIKPPYKPVTPARLGMLLRYTPTKDLYTFLAECKYNDNKPNGFEKYFWWSVNPKKHL